MLLNRNQGALHAHPATKAAAPIFALAACVVGIVLSGISTSDHLRLRATDGTGAMACAALVDSGCKAAHVSEAAELLGVPISHYGTAFYLAGAALAILVLILRRRPHAIHYRPAVGLLVAIMGLGAVGYSVFLATGSFAPTRRVRCASRSTL